MERRDRISGPPVSAGVKGEPLRFYTKEESDKWLSDRQRRKPDLMEGVSVKRMEYPSEPHRFFFVAHCIASQLTFRRPALLLITEWGIWPSSENWHLYYKLRHSYGDSRLLQDAPGHLFLEHEVEDLASFLQVSMLNGWGGYVLTEMDYVNAFFSHDEYIDFFSKESANLPDLAKVFGTRRPQADAR
jgi:hypothetical protein